MNATQEIYSRELISRLLQAHGFRPDVGYESWSKSSRTKDAIAEFDGKHPKLHLMIYNSSEDQLIFETNVDLTATEEPVLDKVISTFDLN